MTNNNVVKTGNVAHFEARFKVLQNIDIPNASNNVLVEVVKGIPVPINDQYCHLTVSIQSADFYMFGTASTGEISIYCRQTNGTLATGIFITLEFVYICN